MQAADSYLTSRSAPVSATYPSNITTTHKYILSVPKQKRREAMQGPTTSNMSFKQAFLKNLLLSLHARTGTSASSFDAMNLHERKATVKASAKVAMATARGRGARWPKAILASACSACKVQRCRRIVVRCRGRKRCLTRGRVAAAWSGGGGDVARRLVRRTMALREVIPGCRDACVDEATLLGEAMDYVVHLRAQVDVLRRVTSAVERSSSIVLQSSVASMDL